MSKRLLTVFLAAALVISLSAACSQKQQLSPEDQALLDKSVAVLQARNKALEEKNAKLAADLKTAKAAAEKPNATLAEKQKALELQKEQLATIAEMKTTQAEVKQTEKKLSSSKTSTTTTTSTKTTKTTKTKTTNDTGTAAQTPPPNTTPQTTTQTTTPAQTAWQEATAKFPFTWTKQKAVLPPINVSADKLSVVYSSDLTKIVVIGPDTVIEEKHGGISSWVSSETILSDRYYSTNGGTTWATVKPAPSNDEYNSLHGLSDTYLCYANGVFLARSSFQNRSFIPRYVSSLSNGKMSQVELPLSAGMIGKIVSGGDRFFVIGTYADPKNPYAMMYMAWSSNGVNWTQVPMSAIGAKNAETVSVMGVITTAPGSDLSTYFKDIFYGAGRFWGQRTDGKLLSSSDAVTWTAGGTPPFEIKKITGGDGKYVGTDDYGGKIAYSSDGINWRELNIPVRIESLAYGGGWFLGAGGGAWFYSSDGINWNIVIGGLDSLHGMEAKNFVYDGSKFIANFYAHHYYGYNGKGYEYDDTWAYSVRR